MLLFLIWLLIFTPDEIITHLILHPPPLSFLPYKGDKWWYCISSFIEVNSTIIAGFVRKCLAASLSFMTWRYWCFCFSSAIFLLASRSAHFTAAPPPRSEEQCLSEALTTVFSTLHQALTLGHITAVWELTGRDLVRDRCVTGVW